MKTFKTSWQNRINEALNLGSYIAWNEGSDFVEELEMVHRELVMYSKAQPKKALEYFEVFLAGCLVKGNEVDDSGAELGMFLDDLFQSWARCCANADMKPVEFIRKIAHWIRVDDIGFCCDLEKTVIPALSLQYRSALQNSLEQRLVEKRADETLEPKNDRLFQYQSNLATLKKLLMSTNNTTALIEAGKRYGFTQADYLALTKIFTSRGKMEEALEWAGRGLKYDKGEDHHRDELEQLRRQLMVKTGRREEAVQEAWEKFERFSSMHTFKDVLACAKRTDKKELMNKALAVFEKSDLRHAVEAFHELGAIDPLIRRIDVTKEEELKKLFYSTAVPIAKSIAKKFPKQAARLYIAQGLDILDHKKSKAYHHAHDYFHQAKTLFEMAGKKEIWLQWVKNIRCEHRLKSGFMPGFEKIVSGTDSIQTPSFMDLIANKLDLGTT